MSYFTPTSDPTSACVTPPVPGVSFDLVAGQSFSLYFRLFILDRLIDTSAWDVRFTVRRTANGPIVAEYDQDSNALDWRAALTAWEINLNTAQTAAFAPIATGPGPRPWEMMLYDVFVDPGASWSIPHMDPTPFLAMTGQCRIFPSA